ncbi:protein hunchback [Periplaneta americana]|uniref:protein hunchback n=1 Tax=Periplaneta americana TaxID=6978 RepID=UPI0037E73FA8
MDVEHQSHSPNNDSGISPGHGSSGSSAGRPSPGQSASFGSPEHTNIHENQTVKSEPEEPNSTSNQLGFHSPTQHNAVWGINLLQHLPPRTLPPPSVSPSYLRLNGSAPAATQNRKPNTSPFRNTSPVQSLVTATPSKSPSTKTTSPRHIQNPPSSGMKTPPGNETNAPPGLNPGLSDNSRSPSVSSSSPSLMDEDNEYYKMQEAEERQNPMACLELVVEQTPNMGEVTPGGSSTNGMRNIFQCPLCSYSTHSRIEFNSHTYVHCPEKKCNKCEFTTKNLTEFHTHLREVHLVSPSAAEASGDSLDEQPGIRVPKINSQGKVKTFRCKQCGHIALTKLAFWEHSRCHIREDKLLSCPRCPFVTEFKHHLEYHLRNHANSKPFKCTQCSYSCVNKSMLNSHLKSHSTVYQYRCAGCTYATKYCHSLKLHLRKYCHEPAMVLNPDGTPNPLPIIDVYGTRRGPKSRPKKTKSPSQEYSQEEPAPVQTSPAPVPVYPVAYPVTPQQNVAVPISYPYNPMMSAGFPVMSNNNHLVPAFPQNVQERSSEAQEHMRNMSHENYENFIMANSQYYHMNANSTITNNNNITDPNALKEIVYEKPSLQQSTEEMYIQKGSKATPGVTPLDLSKPESMENSPQAPGISVNSVSQCKSPSALKAKNRRKGQAYKLDNITRKLQQQCNVQQEERGNNTNFTEDEKAKSPQPAVVVDSENNCKSEQKVQKMDEHLPKIDNEKGAAPGNHPKSYHCSYCDIIFSDVVLYTMHKGYHGFEDPFKCNMCGEQTANKVEFFLHIARSSHC